MKKCIFGSSNLSVKDGGLPNLKSDYYKDAEDANKRIAKSINKNRIEEGSSIEKARAFVTNV